MQYGQNFIQKTVAYFFFGVLLFCGGCTGENEPYGWKPDKEGTAKIKSIRIGMTAADIVSRLGPPSYVGLENKCLYYIHRLYTGRVGLAPARLKDRCTYILSFEKGVLRDIEAVPEKAEKILVPCGEQTPQKNITGPLLQKVLQNLGRLSSEKSADMR